VEHAPASDDPAVRRLDLRLRAIHARVHDRGEEAVEVTRELAEAYPDEPGLLADHVSALIRADREDDALSVVNRALEQVPWCADLHRLRGVALGKLGRDEEALAALAEAERLYRSVGNEEGIARTTGDRASLLPEAGTLGGE
jgi:Flp pilus assembly protein TadD